MREPFAAPDPAEVARVVLVQLHFLGDTLLTTPALRALRRRFPEARIEALVKRRCLAVLERNPNVDLLTPYDPPSIWERPLYWRRLARRWDAERVDLCVDFTGDGRSARMLRAMRPRRAVGILRAADDPLVQAGVPRSCGMRHVARHFLDLAALAGAPGEEPMEFHPSEGARREAAAFRARTHGPLIAIHAGGNEPKRRWPLERFAAAAQALTASAGARVWAAGSRAERPLGERLARDASALDLTGRTTIDQMAALFEASDLVIANDSGPLHLAAAVGTPTLALFGPSHPATCAPIGAGHAFLHGRAEGCPCAGKHCARGAESCLHRITPDMVADAAARLLAQGRRLERAR